MVSAAAVLLASLASATIREALSARTAATSSRARSESACNFHNDGEFSARLSSSSSVDMRATADTIRKSTRATLPRRLFSSRYSALHASASAPLRVRLKKRMGTTWRNFGSATRTNIRMDSSTWRILVSSVEICCGVTADRIACTSTAGLWDREGEALTPEGRALLAGTGVGSEAKYDVRRIGGRRSRACFNFETRRNLSRAVL